MWVSDADIAKQIASGAERNKDAARSPLQASCAMLAKMGCVVLCINPPIIRAREICAIQRDPLHHAGWKPANRHGGC
jgi:hypothetical protein